MEAETSIMKTLVSSWLLLSSTLALVLSFVVFSQAADSAPSNGQNNGSTRPALRGQRALGPFTIFDANHDGVISSDEIAAAPAALAKLDTNHDGRITATELRPPAPRPPRDEGGPRDRPQDSGGDRSPAPPEP